MARKTPGIYIAIRGDYSAFETDLNRAKLVAKEQGEAIAKSIGNAVSKADLTGGINKLTRELKTAQTALSSGAFKAQVSGLHIRHIREKIEINPKEPRYLKVVWGVGYKIEAGA